MKLMWNDYYLETRSGFFNCSIRTEMIVFYCNLGLFLRLEEWCTLKISYLPGINLKSFYLAQKYIADSSVQIEFQQTLSSFIEY